LIFFMLNESVLFVFRMMIFLHEFATNAVKQCSIFRGTEAKKTPPENSVKFPGSDQTFPMGISLPFSPLSFFLESFRTSRFPGFSLQATW